MSILCYAEGCIHNKDGECDKKAISIAWKASSEFQGGERVCYPTCEDCDCEEEEED